MADNETEREASLRGVDHRGERYVHLDDLLLTAQQYHDVWAGHDAAPAFEAFIEGLNEWSLDNPNPASAETEEAGPPACDVIVDISSRRDGPAGVLSNFTPNSFTVLGVPCESMEGFLQSLKEPDPVKAEAIRQLSGWEAKKAGAKLNWAERQQLYWEGEVLDRQGVSYQVLLNRAFDALFDQCESALAALLATGKAKLVHSIGKADTRVTVLTEAEFCERLTRIRAGYQARHTVIVGEPVAVEDAGVIVGDGRLAAGQAMDAMVEHSDMDPGCPGP